MTHISVSKRITGSDNSLSPDRRQTIIWTNAGILLICTLGTNFGEILIEIHTFLLKKMLLIMSSAKWRPFVSASLWSQRRVPRLVYKDRIFDVQSLANVCTSVIYSSSLFHAEKMLIIFINRRFSCCYLQQPVCVLVSIIMFYPDSGTFFSGGGGGGGVFCFILCFMGVSTLNIDPCTSKPAYYKLI